MNQVVVNAEMLAQLHGLNAPLDFCNEQGKVLGHFVPYSSGISPADFEPAISPEEFHRRAERFEGRPLAELLAEWEKRK